MRKPNFKPVRSMNAAQMFYNSLLGQGVPPTKAAPQNVREGCRPKTVVIGSTTDKHGRTWLRGLGSHTVKGLSRTKIKKIAAAPL